MSVLNNSTCNVSCLPTETSSNFNKSEIEPKVAMILRLCISSLICMAGIVGNLMVCIIMFSNRKRSAVNYYILNLAIADLGILLICYPFTVIKSNDPSGWPLGKFICQTLYPLSDIFYGASIASIVAIALDRYKAIVHSMRRKKTLQAVKWVLLFIWLSAFVLIVFPLYFVMTFIEIKSERYTDCTPLWPTNISFQIYVTSLSVFWYALPLCIILWAYRKIAEKINISRELHKDIRKQCYSYYLRSNKSHGESTSSGASLTRASPPKNKKFEDHNIKALKILVPIVVMFALLMLPFHVFRLSQAFLLHLKDLISHPWLIYNICTVLLLANSSANPIIYSLVSHDFRKRYRKLFSFRKPVKHMDELCVVPSTPLRRKPQSLQGNGHISNKRNKTLEDELEK